MTVKKCHRAFRRDCYSLDAPRHLILYTPRSIRQLIESIPEFRIVRLHTHSRIARKIYGQWRILRRSGSFRAPNVKLTPADRLGALLFSYAESLGGVGLPLGEEIELVAERRG